MSKYAEELLAEQKQEVLSADYTKAVSLTRRIKANALAAQESLWELCKGLKEMHDSKLYKELGYSSFEKYTEDEVGIKRHQAQKYIAIADMENGDSNHHFGVTKLALLARLDEPQREQIQQNVDVESVSVKELKKEIVRLSDTNAILHGNIINEQNKSMQLQSQLDSVTADRDQEHDRCMELEKQVEELEARPVEVVAKPDEEIIKAHLREIDSLQRQHKEELDELRDTYQKQMNEGIAKARKEAQAPDIGELWRALDTALDNAIEAIEDFFDDYDDHPKIKSYANALKKTVRDLNTMVNNVLAGGSS